MAVLSNVIDRCIIEAISVTTLSQLDQVTICDITCLKFCYDLDVAQDSKIISKKLKMKP